MGVGMKEILQKQREFFKRGATLPQAFRLESLRKLKSAIKNYESHIFAALYKDLGKSETESYMCEISLCLGEIDYFLKNLKKLSKDKTVPTPLSNFPAKSIIKTVPMGNVLILSPWNYPFLLSIEPLIEALAAGNTVVLKPSAYSPNTSSLIKNMLGEIFAQEYVSVITGGREENKNLLSEKFDYIFFTGSTAVGKEVLRRAAENLTPVSLELGGKSPCIVDESADIKLSARRIVFGKFLNCGQTCVAPDYILCQESILPALTAALKAETEKQFGKEPLLNPDYGKIVNDKHFKRILSLIDWRKVILGGKSDENSLKIEPTLMTDVSWSDAVMKEEIFGPILPILSYKNLNEVIQSIEDKPHPLALYIFSKNKENIKNITEHCRYGGGCVNDVILHLATPYLPFGGVGESGMGCYHGKFGFETFSRKKSILHKSTLIDIALRYQPYTGLKKYLLKFFLK